MNEEAPEKWNLTKFIARSGVASRRAASDLVKSGRVTVNGLVVTEPGRPVNADETIAIDGRPLKEEPRRYVMLNKPRGYVCTNSDRHAAQLAVDLIGASERLYSAGRLDAESEGLLIFSNDGDYVLQLTHPRYEILKEYTVTLNRELTETELKTLHAGIHDAGEWLKPRAITSLGKQNYRFILNEGKKREIRRLVQSTGARVESLKRCKIGTLELGSLQPGRWRELSEAERAASLKNPKKG